MRQVTLMIMLPISRQPSTCKERLMISCIKPSQGTRTKRHESCTTASPPGQSRSLTRSNRHLHNNSQQVSTSKRLCSPSSILNKSEADPQELPKAIQRDLTSNWRLLIGHHSDHTHEWGLECTLKAFHWESSPKTLDDLLQQIDKYIVDEDSEMILEEQDSQKAKNQLSIRVRSARDGAYRTAAGINERNVGEVTVGSQRWFLSTQLFQVAHPQSGREGWLPRTASLAYQDTG